MRYEISVFSCSRNTLEAELNKPAAQGWQLVSCWPEDGTVTAVMQRPTDHVKTSSSALPPSTAPASATPPSTATTPPSSLPDIDGVLNACLAQPERTGKTGKPYRALSVPEFASSLNVGEEELVTHLRDLGIKRAEEGKDKWHKEYYIKLMEFKSGELHLSINHAPPKKRRN